jgi:membrane protease YdiL (CAAX protease family)
VWLALLAYGVAMLVGQTLASFHHPAGLSEAELKLQQSILAGNIMQVLVIVAGLWIARQTFVAGWRGFGLGRDPLFRDLFAGIAGFLAAFCLCTVVAWLTEWLISRLAPQFKMPTHTVFEALRHPATSTLVSWVAFWGAFVLAPVGEEILFRGIFQTGLHRATPPRWHSLRHRWIAIAIASLIFGLMHWPVAQHVPALTVLAVVLGYQYERSGSLIVPIIVHILFNAKSLLWHWLQTA